MTKTQDAIYELVSAQSALNTPTPSSCPSNYVEHAYGHISNALRILTADETMKLSRWTVSIGTERLLQKTSWCTLDKSGELSIDLLAFIRAFGYEIPDSHKETVVEEVGHRVRSRLPFLRTNAPPIDTISAIKAIILSELSQLEREGYFCEMICLRT